MVRWAACILVLRVRCNILSLGALPLLTAPWQPDKLGGQAIVRDAQVDGGHNKDGREAKHLLWLPVAHYYAPAFSHGKVGRTLRRWKHLSPRAQQVPC